MTLYFRTEANQITATGHMMRCLAIADAAAEIGIAAVFIVAERCSEKFPAERGHQVICLNRQWDDFDGEIPVIERLIEDHHIEILLIDSYYITKSYMEAMTEITKTVYIDDLHETIWPCRVLINYAVYAGLFDYQKEYPAAELLLGCSYMPLHKGYRNVLPGEIHKKVEKVLVVTGGADELHFMKRFTELVLADREAFETVEFTLICGAFNKDMEEIKDVLRQSVQCVDAEELLQNGERFFMDHGVSFRIYPALPTLKDAITESDLMITAGGTTLYEMAVCGTPGICFSIAENQMNNVREFSRRGLALYAGDLRKDFSFEGLKQMMLSLMQDVKERTEMSKRQRTLIDGRGALRIAEALMKGSGSER